MPRKTPRDLTPSRSQPSRTPSTPSRPPTGYDPYSPTARPGSVASARTAVAGLGKSTGGTFVELPAAVAGGNRGKGTVRASADETGGGGVEAGESETIAQTLFRSEGGKPKVTFVYGDEIGIIEYKAPSFDIAQPLLESTTILAFSGLSLRSLRVAPAASLPPDLKDKAIPIPNTFEVESCEGKGRARVYKVWDLVLKRGRGRYLRGERMVGRGGVYGDGDGREEGRLDGKGKGKGKDVDEKDKVAGDPGAAVAGVDAGSSKLGKDKNGPAGPSTTKPVTPSPVAEIAGMDIDMASDGVDLNLGEGDSGAGSSFLGMTASATGKGKGRAIDAEGGYVSAATSEEKSSVDYSTGKDHLAVAAAVAGTEMDDVAVAEVDEEKELDRDDFERPPGARAWALKVWLQPPGAKNESIDDFESDRKIVDRLPSTQKIVNPVYKQGYVQVKRPDRPWEGTRWCASLSPLETPLTKILRSDPPCDEATRDRLLQSFAQSVAHTNLINYSLRDVKPDNAVVTAAGDVLLIDTASAIRIGSIIPGDRIATRPYAPPSMCARILLYTLTENEQRLRRLDEWNAPTPAELSNGVDGERDSYVVWWKGRLFGACSLKAQLDQDRWATGASFLEYLAPNTFQQLCGKAAEALGEAEAAIRKKRPDPTTRGPLEAARLKLAQVFRALGVDCDWKSKVPLRYHPFLTRCFQPTQDNGLFGTADGEQDSDSDESSDGSDHGRVAAAEDPDIHPEYKEKSKNPYNASFFRDLALIGDYDLNSRPVPAPMAINHEVKPWAQSLSDDEIKLNHFARTAIFSDPTSLIRPNLVNLPHCRSKLVRIKGTQYQVYAEWSTAEDGVNHTIRYEEAPDVTFPGFKVEGRSLGCVVPLCKPKQGVVFDRTKWIAVKIHMLDAKRESDLCQGLKALPPGSTIKIEWVKFGIKAGSQLVEGGIGATMDSAIEFGALQSDDIMEVGMADGEGEDLGGAPDAGMGNFAH